MSWEQTYEQWTNHQNLESGLKQQYGVDFSMGLAILTELTENLEDATKIADQLMYESKSLGKSQTTIQTLMNTEPAF